MPAPARCAVGSLDWLVTICVRTQGHAWEQYCLGSFHSGKDGSLKLSTHSREDQ